MTEAAISSLREALGVSRPIRIDVWRENPSEARRAQIDAPFAVIGRTRRCSVSLADPRVAFRHVYLQAFGDRVTCIDLLSPTGITWYGRDTAGWLSPQHQIGVGPYKLQLADDGWESNFDNRPSPLECKTRTTEATPFGALPLVHLELQNHRFKGMAWPINRVLTLVGRDDRCRITCADARISRVHCSLLLTPYGLFVIDLLGRGGIRVNNQPRSVSFLGEGDELGVGQYLMRAAYESAPKQLPAEEPLAAADADDSGDTEEINVPAEVLSPEDSLPSPEFLTRNNRIFPVTIATPVVIVEPQGGVRSSGYQQIQLESNIITQLLKTRSKLSHVVVDIHHADAMDSIVINAVMSMCRAAKGKAVICNASESMLSVLSELSLTKVWPHFPTREEALQHIARDG